MGYFQAIKLDVMDQVTQKLLNANHLQTSTPKLLSLKSRSYDAAAVISFCKI